MTVIVSESNNSITIAENVQTVTANNAQVTVTADNEIITVTTSEIPVSVSINGQTDSIAIVEQAVNIVNVASQIGLESVVAGVNISIDSSDPLNPVINSLSDRYKTTSTTSQAIVPSGTITFTVVENLSYVSQQEVIIAYDSNNHMHGTVVSYSGTSLVVEIRHKTGSGTYSAWSINLDGTPVDALTGTGTIDELGIFTGSRVLGSTNIKTINSTSLLGSGNISIPTTSPAGSTGNVQFNDAGAFGADSDFIYDKNTNTLTIKNLLATSGTFDKADVVTTIPPTTNFNINFTYDPSGFYADGTNYSYIIYSYLSGVYDIVGVANNSSDPNDGNYYYIDLSWDAISVDGYLVYDANNNQYLDAGNVTYYQITPSTSWVGGVPPNSPSAIITPQNSLYSQSDKDASSQDINAFQFSSTPLRFYWDYNNQYLKFESYDNTLKTLRADINADSITFAGTPLVNLLAAKQNTLVSGVNIKTINSASILGSGNISLPTTSPAGSNTQIQYNNSGAFGANSNFVFDGNAQGIGVATPLTTRQHMVAPTVAYTTLTGTITSIAASVFDCTVTGSGTLFTSQLRVGDTLVHPTTDSIRAVVTRIISDTSCTLIGNFISGYSGANFRRYRAINANDDSSGTTIYSISQNSYNPITGTTNLPTHLLRGDVLVQNTSAPQHGIYMRTAFNDGRMRIGHSNASSYIQFQQGNANIGLEAVTLSNSLWSMALRLGGASFSTGQNSIYFDKTGNGVSQTIKMSTESYAQNGVQPAYEIYGTTLGFGTRDTTWNNYFGGTLTLKMDSAGDWSTERPFKLKGYTVATLPTGSQGQTAFVTDALAPTYLTAVVGGGAVVCPVFHNGTTWVVH